MSLPASHGEGAHGLFVRFTVNKTESLFGMLLERKNTLLIAGTSSRARFFGSQLKNKYNSILINEIEDEKSGDYSAKSLIKFQNPFILITGSFSGITRPDIERIVYFRIPLRIDELISDIQQVKREKGLEIVLLIDPEDYSAMPDKRDNEGSVRMYEWISGGGCLLAGLGPEAAQGECGICGNCSGKRDFVPEGIGLKTLSLVSSQRKGITMGRLIGIGQGNKSADMFFPGYGVLRGIQLEKIVTEVFHLKNMGMLEFKNLGSEIVVSAAGTAVQGMK